MSSSLSEFFSEPALGRLHVQGLFSAIHRQDEGEAAVLVEPEHIWACDGIP